MLITESYRDQLRQLHTTKTRWGSSSPRWLTEVLDLAYRLDARTVLDYGCGKGLLGPDLNANGYLVHEYDPGIEGKDAPPTNTDLVVCLDVLEHIEPECLADVLADLERLALKGLLLVIALYPAGNVLPDGRNAHLIVEPREWWEDRLDAAFNDLKWEIKYRHHTRPTRNPNKRKDALVVEITRS